MRYSELRDLGSSAFRGLFVLLFLTVGCALPRIVGAADDLKWESLEIYGGWMQAGGLLTDPRDPSHVYAVASFPIYVYESFDAGQTWTRLRGMGDQHWDWNQPVCHLSPVNPDVLYVGNEVSRDGGQIWQSHGLAGFVFALDPNDADVIYCSNTQGDGFPYRRTIDGGASWESIGPIASGYTARLLVADREDSGVLYCLAEGASTGLFKSTDYGTTWQSKPLYHATGGGYFTKLVIDPFDNQILLAFAIGNGGIYRSEDAGETWSTVYSPDGRKGFYYAMPNPLLQGEYYAFTEQDSSNPVRTLRSTDSGATWQTMSEDELELAQTVLAATCTSNTVLAGMTFDHGISSSSDDGATWVRSNTGLRGIEIKDIHIHPDHSPRLIHVGTRRGIFQGNGTHWEEVGDSRYQAQAIIDDPFNPGVMYYSGESFLFQSNDYGETWSLIHNTESTENATRMYAAYASPVTPGLIVFGAQSTWRCNGRVVISQDGGLTFSVTDLPTVGALDWIEGGPIEGGRAIYSAGDSGWWCGETASGHVIKSTDEGLTWDIINDDLEIASQGLAVDPTDGNVIYVGDTAAGDVYGSAQGTGTLPEWYRIKRQGDLFTASYSTDGLTYNAIGNVELDLNTDIYVGLAVSVDSFDVSTTATFDSVSWPSGESWENTDIGFVQQAGWASENTGEFEIGSGGNSLDARHDSFHFVYQPLSGDGEIIARITGIGGQENWSKAFLMMRETITPGSRSVFIGMAGNRTRLFQYRRDRTDRVPLHKSVDGGLTWTEIGPWLDEDQDYEIAWDIEINEKNTKHVFVSTWTRVYVSRDAGETWKVASQNLSRVGVLRFVPDASRADDYSGTLYAAMDGGLSYAVITTAAKAEPLWGAYE